MGKTIGIIAIKGGVGKTTTTLNLGAVFAHEFKKKTLLVDANFSAPNLGLHLGLVDPETSLHQVFKGEADIHDSIHEYDEHLDIIPGALLGNNIDPKLLKEKLKDIKDEYDIILLDSSPALNEEILATMVAADNLFVVTSPDYPTLSTTMHAVKIAKERNTPIKGLIINKVRNKKFELSLHDIEEATGVPVVAVLPDDIKLLEALSVTTPLVHHTENRHIIYEYKKLAACILGEAYVDNRLITRLKRLFSKDVPKVDVNRLELKGHLKNEDS